MVTRGRVGLRSFSTPHTDTTEAKERRCLVQKEVTTTAEVGRLCRTVGMRQHWACTRWENTIERMVTWVELWEAEPQQTKVLIQVVYDMLPSL